LDLLDLLFETHAFFFPRPMTLFVAALSWFFIYRRLRKLIVSALVVVFLFLCHEWSWQIAILLRWGLVTPNLDWLQYQKLLPLADLFYFNFLVIVWPHVLKVTNKKFLLKAFLAQLSLWLVLNFASPSIYFNDDGYAFIIQKIVVDYWTKLAIVSYSWVIPKLGVVGCALNWRAKVDS